MLIHVGLTEAIQTSRVCGGDGGVQRVWNCYIFPEGCFLSNLVSIVSESGVNIFEEEK